MTMTNAQIATQKAVLEAARLTLAQTRRTNATSEATANNAVTDAQNLLSVMSAQKLSEEAAAAADSQE